MVRKCIRVNPEVLGTKRMRIPFNDDPRLVRLDRNEDLLGWPVELLADFIQTLQPTDFLRYPFTDRLREKIADASQVSPNSVWVTAGCDEALSLIFRSYLERSGACLSLDPSYGMYEVLTSLQGAKLHRATDLESSLSRIELIGKIIERERPSIVVVANPNQPSGRELSVTEIASLVRLQSLHGGVLVIDEAYFGFGSPSSVSLLPSHENLLITRTFSKAYGMAGLRIGYVLASSTRIEEISRVAPLCEANSLAVGAAEYVLNHHTDFDFHKDEVVRSRNRLALGLQNLGLRVLNPRTNFVIMSTGDNDDNEHLQRRLLVDGFAVRGPLHVPEWGSGLRVTTPQPSLLSEFLSAVENALASE